MPIVIKRPQAYEDLKNIGKYISQDNLENAIHFINFLEKKINMLAVNPGIGRKRVELDIPELRSFPVRNYLIFYRPIKCGVEVIRVLHGNMDIPCFF